MNEPNNRKTPVSDNAPDTDAETPSPEYKVGPGFPPREYQFKKGQSGNPKGAKRKPRSIALDLNQLMERALNQKITLKQGERKELITKGQAGIEQLANQFARGDRHARRDLIHLAEKIGFDLAGRLREGIEAALAPDNQAILDAYVARLTTAQTPTTRVLAPPELLDDDTEEG
jgi:uncharacterized protein DUF5681